MPEITVLEEVHQAAQARLGLALAYVSLEAWTAVSATAAVETGQAWMGLTLQLLAAIRSRSRALSIAYYQYARALDTGHTLGQIEGHAGPVKLDDLRANFRRLATEVSSIGTGHLHTSDPLLARLDREVAHAKMFGRGNSKGVRFEDTNFAGRLADLSRFNSDGHAPIGVDSFTWPRELTPHEVADSFSGLLHTEALEAQDAKLKRIENNKDLSPQEVRSQAEKAHAVTGANGAGLADWAGITAGRDVIQYASRRDRRVRAIARGTGPNPCYFCAMLASRGFVYASAESAGGKNFGGHQDEIEKFHVNCHCYPIVRWVVKPEEDAKMTALEKAWGDHGGSGKAGMKAWRKWWTANGASVMAQARINS